jgi:hypothetical protein
LWTYPVDGQVYAQPLYMAQVLLPDGSYHDVVYVATEHDSVYALDADDPTAGPNGDGVLWQTSFIDPDHGITPFTVEDAYGCDQISPELGITSTPVIDPDTGILYVVSQTAVQAGDTRTYHQTLHALDVGSGHEQLGGPVDIQASVVNDSGQTVTFNPQDYKERAALTLSGGVLYTAWTSHCDFGENAHGWVIGYDAATLQQVSVFNTSPNGRLNSIWQGDGGLAADAAGNLYFETGNGTDITGYGDDYSEAFLRLDGGDGQTVDDYFIPADFMSLDEQDLDLGSGAPVALPDQPGAHPHLLVGSGKDGRIYLIDRDNMGGLNNPPDGPDLIVQELPDAVQGGSWDTPAYFDGGAAGRWVYYAGWGDTLKAWGLTNGLLSTSPTSQSPTLFSERYGATPVVSANGTRDGIVWALEADDPAILRAYDATDVSRELWNSNQTAGDAPGPGMRFNSPIVADAKVFVPTDHYLTIYGLLGGPRGAGSRLDPLAAGRLLAADNLSRAQVYGPAAVVPAREAEVHPPVAPAFLGGAPGLSPAAVRSPAADRPSTHAAPPAGHRDAVEAADTVFAALVEGSIWRGES